MSLAGPHSPRLERTHCVTPSAKRHGDAVDDETAASDFAGTPSNPKSRGSLPDDRFASRHSTLVRSAGRPWGARRSAGLLRTVHIHGRYAIALVLDGVVLCNVPVGPTENAPASTME